MLIFVFPPLYGEGYEAFVSLMQGDKSTIFENSLFYDFKHIEGVVLICRGS